MGVLGATVVRLLCEEQGPEKQAMLISSLLGDQQMAQCQIPLQNWAMYMAVKLGF